MQIEATGASAGGGQLTGGRRVNSGEFMKLLTTQLANQSPLNPTSDTDFMAQLAQLASMEEQQAQTKMLEQVVFGIQATNVLQGLGNASTLIDRGISFWEGDVESEGTVTGVTFANGSIQLEVDGKLVNLGDVTSVASQAPREGADEGSDQESEIDPVPVDA